MRQPDRENCDGLIWQASWRGLVTQVVKHQNMNKVRLYKEYAITYPANWEIEYKNSGYIGLWRELYPDQFEDWMGSTRIGTMDLFPQYALMFLLRDQQGINSITWYELAATSKTSKNMKRRLRYWNIMQEWMGATNFETLKASLHKNGFNSLKGEPDLFCWKPDTKKWFFAEAKGKDRLLESQLTWFETCQKALGELSDIRIYQLLPSTEDV